MMSELPGPTTTKVLEPDLLNYIEDIVNSHGLPGLSVAVVHADSSAEFANWGNRNEEGDAMTSDVSIPLYPAYSANRH